MYIVLPKKWATLEYENRNNKLTTELKSSLRFSVLHIRIHLLQLRWFNFIRNIYQNNSSPDTLSSKAFLVSVRNKWKAVNGRTYNLALHKICKTATEMREIFTRAYRDMTLAY